MSAAAARAAGRYRAQLAALAFAAGVALASAPPEALGAVLICAATGGLALAPRAAPLLLCLLLAGVLVGDARLRSIERGERGLAAAGSISVDARAHLLERPRRSSFGTTAAVRIVSGPGRGLRLLARAPAGMRWPADARPGGELRVRGSARPLEAHRARVGGGHAPAAFDFAAHLRRRGIAGELTLRGVAPGSGRRGGLAGLLDVARGRAERALSERLRPREAALARGFVLGQDEGVDALLRADFRDSGLAHLLAVSGQNVMLLCALALPLLALAGLGVRGRVAALIALVAAYVPLAGAGPSLQRAAVMGAAGLVALAAGRPASRLYALLLAAAVTLVLSPRVYGDPGWQLSFAAVAGIAALSAPVSRSLMTLAPPRLASGDAAGRLARALADGVAMTIAATAATLPLLAVHFGTVPLAGVLANVAALPAVAPVMWLGMARAALGQLAPVPLVGSLAAAAAGVLGPPLGLLLRFIAAVATETAARSSPLALELSPLAAGAAYGLTGTALLAIRLRRRSQGSPDFSARHLLSGRRLPAGRRLLMGGLLLAAAGALGPSPPALLRQGPPDALTVSFLDVGQGDATLIQHPGGATVLFDGGPPEARVLRLLRRAGVRRLDVLVATHPSRDHHGGLAELIAGMPVGLLLEGGDGTADPSFRALLREARRRGIPTVPARAGARLRVGGLGLDVLSPAPRPPGPPPRDPNPRAVVALVSSGAFDLLLSADAESGALLPLALPDVEAFKVPHHGSADPGLARLLERVRPEIASIPVGANRYGHPAPSTLAALRARVPYVYRNDRDGTVRLTVRAGIVSVRTGR